MRSPTAALLWEIGRRGRRSVWVIFVLSLFGWLVDSYEGAARLAGGGEPTPLNVVLGMLSFLVLFGIFNYTESSGDKGFGRFPHRLFTLPVSSLRLVAVPVLTAVASVELLYVVWMERLSFQGSTSPLFIGVLLAAFMVLYQAVLWTLERLGTLRLVVLGLIGTALFGAGFLPSFPASSPSPWHSEAVLAGLVAGLASGSFLLTWRHVARLRSGGGRGRPRLEPVIGRVADALPGRRGGFASPTSAHFWFEWRCSGTPLPLLVAGVLMVVIGPLSWLVRNDPGDTLQLLLWTLAMPVLLAIPVGIAFSKPTFWSEDLSLPEFVAVRPLAAEEMVASKVKVAALGVVISWLAVLAFLCLWLSSWANLDALSRLTIQWWAFHNQSVYAVYGIAALIVIAGMFLTWRFLLTSLWSGLSGRRALYLASPMLLALVAIAWVVFDPTRLPGWVLEDPERMIPFLWMAALAVAAKCWFAAHAWRHIAPRLVRQYLLVWLVGTACFIALGVMLWGVMRIYLPMDIYRFQSLVILVALLVVPLGRLGLARSFLAGSRHRR